MYIFAAVSANRQRLVDAEAEFLGLLKAVRQQKCRMSPLSTTRNPYRAADSLSCEKPRRLPRSFFLYRIQSIEYY
jgi:hypothetical protein